MEDVQRLLEKSVAEVEDLVARQLLSKDEARALVAKRKDFETRLHRFEAIRSDYLQYVEYELSLEKFVAAVRKRLRVSRRGVADYACTSRVNFIFDRALKKFQGDLDLWVAAIDFSQLRKCEKRTSKLLASALKHFPTREGFWVLAASHELEHNKDVAKARAAMMQGLRVNPKSRLLWEEYFKLEFLFVLQLLERRDALGLAVDDAAATPVLRGDILKIVYRNALGAFPSEQAAFAFRARFLAVCDAFAPTNASSVAKHMEEFILSEAVKECGDRDVNVWVECAMRSGEDEKREAVLSAACKALPTTAMWDARIRLAGQANVPRLAAEAHKCGLLAEASALAWVRALKEAAPQSTATSNKRPRRGSTSSTSADAAAGGAASWLDVLLQMNAEFPQSRELWVLRCAHDAKAATLALGKVRAQDSLEFWRMHLAMQDSPEAREGELVRALCLLRDEHETSLVVQELVCDALLASGDEAGNVITRVLEKKAINCIPLECFKRVLGIESTEASTTAASPNARRTLFEMCVARYPQCAEVWAAYIGFAEDDATDQTGRLRAKVLLRGMRACPELKDALERSRERA